MHTIGRTGILPHKKRRNRPTGRETTERTSKANKNIGLNAIAVEMLVIPLSKITIPAEIAYPIKVIATTCATACRNRIGTIVPKFTVLSIISFSSQLLRLVYFFCGESCSEISATDQEFPLWALSRHLQNKTVPTAKSLKGQAMHGGFVLISSLAQLI